MYFVYLYINFNLFKFILGLFILKIFCQYKRAERRGFGAEAPKARRSLDAPGCEAGSSCGLIARAQGPEGARGMLEAARGW